MIAQAKKIVLIGAGGHCESCIDLIESSKCFSIIGVVDKDLPVNSEFLGYRVLGDDSCLHQFRNQADLALVAVGQIRTPLTRIRLFELIIHSGFKSPVIVSPFAYVSKHATVMEGSTVHHGAIINASALVGHNTIINSQALIEHNAVVGPHCHISTGVKINGHALVGTGTFIGSGAVIGNNVNIGTNCVVSAGCVVLKDIPDNTWVRHNQSTSL